MERNTIASVDSASPKAQEFLSELWKRSRPLFKDSEMNSFGPDSSYDEINFVCGDQKLIARSWHRIYEENPKFVVTSIGISSLEGKTRQEVLSRDESWYLDFRKGFDQIYDEALTFTNPIGDKKLSP